jgi:hypothetical protein
MTHLATLARLATLAVGAGSLWGCAVPYQEPSGDSVATIEFRNESAGAMSTHMYAGAKECTDRTAPGGVQAQSKKRVKVLAERRLVFTAGMDTKGAGAVLAFGALGAVVGGSIYKGCTPTIDFFPERGRTYVFSMASDGSTCTFRFYSESPLGGGEEVKFSEREWIRPMGESGPFCRKK